MTEEKTVSELEALLEKLDTELSSLKEERYKVDKKLKILRDYPKYKKYIGTYWKYRSTYGSSHDKGWWLYGKVIDVTDRGDFIFIQIEKTANGVWEVTANKPWFAMPDKSGWVKSSKKEYDRAWKNMQKYLDKY